MKKLVIDIYEKYIAESVPVFNSMITGEEKEVQAVLYENTLFSIMTYVIAVAKTVTGAITIGSFAKYTGAILQLLNGFGQIVSSQDYIGNIVLNLESFFAFIQKNKPE